MYQDQVSSNSTRGTDSTLSTVSNKYLLLKQNGNIDLLVMSTPFL